MTKKIGLILTALLLIIFTSCKREKLQTNPLVQHLTDFESNDGKINMNIKGGKKPYSVKWSNNKTDSVLTNLAAGTYYVTISDAKKNIFVDTIVLNQPQWPVCIDADNNSYKTAIIGKQTWMVENLNTSLKSNNSEAESWIIDSSSNDSKYGRLYNWNAAMNNSDAEKAQGLCPDGWHIPSNEEWTVLIDNISNSDKEITDLKGGLELTYPGFYNNGTYNKTESESFWTSTQTGNNAWKVYFNKNLSQPFRYHEVKTNGISVRCVKD